MTVVAILQGAYLRNFTTLLQMSDTPSIKHTIVKLLAEEGTKSDSKGESPLGRRLKIYCASGIDISEAPLTKKLVEQF